MKRRAPTGRLATVWLVAVSIWCSRAGAQEGEQLSEVLVTAQKRSQSAQRVTGSLLVLQSEQLSARRIASLDDVAAATPSFSMNQFNIGEPMLYMRGIGSNFDSAGSDPSVGVFLDEVYVGRVSGASFELLDLERVEVLRGPQSLLYGRNTSAGAINLVPRQPDRATYTSASLTVGNHNLMEYSGIAGGALTARSAGRLAFLHRSRAGFSRGIATGESLDDEHVDAARAQWLTALNEDTRVRVSLDWTQDRDGGNARVPGPIFTDQVGTDAIATSALLRIWPIGSSIRRSYSDPETYQRRDILGGLIRLERRLRIGTLTASGSMRRVHLNWSEDLSGVKPFGLPPLPGVPSAALGWVFASTDSAQEVNGQESFDIRLTTPEPQPISWLIGLNHYAESVDRDEDFLTRFSLVPAAGGDVSFDQNARNTSDSVYGMFRKQVTREFAITGGLRLTQDRKEILQLSTNNDPADPVPGIPLFPGQPYSVRARDHWNSISGQAVLEYQFSDAMFGYGQIARGFKAGTYPSQNNVVQNVGEATRPEQVHSLELGAKTEWLRRRLRANLSVFQMYADDLQLFRLDSQLRLLTFNENATIRGAEVEIRALPLRGVEVGVSASLLRARVTVGPNAGDSLPRAPKAKLASQIQYGHAISTGQGRFVISYEWTAKYDMDVPNNRAMIADGYGLLNARISWTSSSSSLEFAAWGRNLTDTERVTHTLVFLGNGFSLYGPPRTYGVSLNWRMF